MGDYNTDKWPAIDERLVPRLRELYPLTEDSLKMTEWDRAFLAGQRDIIQKIEVIRNKQSMRAKTGEHKRQ